MQQIVTQRDGIDWIVSSDPVAYDDALPWMNARAEAVASGTAPEAVWLLEHPPLYTAGTSADPNELRNPAFPVFVAGRGGRYTYHGPGQLVGYLILDLSRRRRDVRCFVHAIEGWLIRALGHLEVSGVRDPGRVGIWTETAQGQPAKVAAIGVRVRRWVTTHGFSINLDPDLTHFAGIVPCGIADRGVTSVAALGGLSYRTAAISALEHEFATFLTELGMQQSA